MSEIKVEVENEYNRVLSSHKFNPEIKNKDAKGSFEKSYNHIIRLGKLGEDTPYRIKISYTCDYYTKRYNNGFFGGSKSGSRTFTFDTMYEYNTKKQIWEKTSKDMTDTKVSMSKMSISSTVNFCKVDFTLDYRFTANRETY
ncbi:MAG: hypothetical protein ACK5LR_11830 [Mangrovibacterium sp.]